ncbi:MAG TPA: hypothetical protein VLG38_07720, partial [Gammaproteobacteria bacterium]|nr:hypothetical protein [Gammaproteobacteria bacterium]
RSAVFAAAPFTSTVVVPGMLVASAWASGIDSQPTRRNLAVLGGAGAALAFGVSNSSMPMFAAFLNAGSWSWAQMTSLVTSVGIVAGATAEVGIPAAIDFARSRNA